MKNIIKIFSISMLCLTMVACSNKYTPINPKLEIPKDGIIEKENVLEEAEIFINAIKEGKYEVAFATLNIKDRSFVDLKYFEEYIKDTDLNNITKNKGEIIDIKSSDSSETEKSLNIRIENEYGKTDYNVICSLNKNKKWQINLPSLYIKDWSIVIPKYSTLIIGDREIDESYREDNEENYDIYRFNEITVGEKEVTVKFFNGESSTQTLIPYDNKADTTFKSFRLVVSDSDIADIKTDFSNIIDNILDNRIAKQDVNSIKGHFTKDVLNVDIQQFYDGLNIEGRQKNVTNPRVLDLNIKDVYYIKKDTVEMSFSLAVVYNVRNSQRQGTSDARIQLTKTDSGWKISTLINKLIIPTLS